MMTIARASAGRKSTVQTKVGRAPKGETETGAALGAIAGAEIQILSIKRLRLPRKIGENKESRSEVPRKFERTRESLADRLNGGKLPRKRATSHSLGEPRLDRIDQRTPPAGDCQVVTLENIDRNQ